MSNGRMWFGTEEYMTWVPEFAPGSRVGISRFTESVKFSNGGGARVRSRAGQMTYELDYPARDATGYSPWGYPNDGLDAFNRFASGEYGSGLMYLSDEMTHDMNVLPRAWATPSLIKEGWPNFFVTKPIFEERGLTDYNLPRLEATWKVPQDTQGYFPKRKSHYLVVPIPPDSYLTFGYTGSTAGSAVLKLDLHDRYGVYQKSVIAQPLGTLDAERTNTIVTGLEAAYVRIYISSNGPGSGRMTISSMIGQIYNVNNHAPIYPSPNLLPSVNTWINGGDVKFVYGDHIDGRGSTGLEFADDALMEEYVMKQGHLKGLSTTLEEVGAWR